MISNNILLNEYLNYIQINESEIFLNEAILNEMSLSNLTKSFHNNFSLIQKTLSKYKIDTSKLKLIGKNISKQIRSLYENNVSIEDAGKEISKSVFNEIKIFLDSNPVIKIGGKISIGIIVYILLIIFHIALQPILLSFISPKMTINLLAIIIAPITEETVKSCFVHMNMPWIGTGVMYGIDFFRYLKRFPWMTNGPKSIIIFIIMRSIILVMHFTTTAIQKFLINNKELDESKAKRTLIAWSAGVMIHSIFNTLTLVIFK